MTQKKVMIVLLVAGFCLCSSAFGEILYTVTNLNSSGSGSFASALTSAESDGQASRIEFSVGGTISQSVRYNITAGSCTISGGSAPSPGITFDFNGASEGFRVTSNYNYFCNIKVYNTAVNSDGISLLGGANNTVERCSFDYCRDEAVGVSGAAARGNVIAYCRIEHCGSQPGDGTNWANGRGILVTSDSSATIVGNYVYYCNRGMTVNYPSGFADMRHNKVDSSLSPASGSGITIVGPSTQGNITDSVAINNALAGFRIKTQSTFYRSNLTGSGNPSGLVVIDADCTEVGSLITVADTPFPSWLSGATTPASLNDVGMGTGTCNCDSGGGGGTKATNPSPANGATGVDINANLSWTAGTGATSHDVYFGTSSSSPTFKGNQTATSYEPGTMVAGTTYYWRIDELPGPITGDLWSFTTASGGGSNGTYYSVDTLDGWVRESTETSGVGGGFSTTATYLGDTSTRQQYIGVLSVDTSAIPDSATITSATLTIRRLGKGGDPTSLGTITVDIKNGYYGTSSSLAAADFEAASSATNVATIPYPASNGVSVSGNLNSTGLAQINKTGLTQFKIRFTTDDDNDGTADYLNIYDSSSNPKLDVTWQ